jgi:guanylate kinase
MSVVASVQGCRGLLLVLSAPSGTGKTTVVQKVVDRLPNIRRSRSYTSRLPRSGEQDGVDYNFIDEGAFRKMVSEGAFIEWADVFGNLYGTSVADTEAELVSGQDIVLVIDVQGAQQVRQRITNVVSIFLLPPSYSALQERLFERSQSEIGPDELDRRLVTAKQEVAARQDYDYIVINDELERCVSTLCNIVTAERSTAEAMRASATLIAESFGT